MTQQAPQGVVGVFTDKRGDVIASVSDFDTSTYAGGTVYDGQKMRAKNALYWAVLRAYCSEALIEGFSSYDAQNIVSRLMQKGAKITIVSIGHAENTDAN